MKLWKTFEELMAKMLHIWQRHKFQEEEGNRKHKDRASNQITNKMIKLRANMLLISLNAKGENASIKRQRLKK